MSDRFDVISFKKTKNAKVYAVRLGSAAKRDDGEGFSCWLDAMPTPGPSGQYEIQIVPQRDKQAPASKQRDDMNDEVPGF